MLGNRRGIGITEGKEIENLEPTELRKIIRQGQWRKPTAGLAPGYAQANLVIVPASEAVEFRIFCRRNPKPCPVLAELPAGQYFLPSYIARDSDIRFDVPFYRLYQSGELKADRLPNLLDLWRNDLVTFLLGCSFGFDGALIKAGLPVRHVEQGVNIPIFRTNRPCVKAGRFKGPLVVSYRPMPEPLVKEAVRISALYPLLHGSPVHVGNPEEIGVNDLQSPDFGDAVQAQPGDVPMFWACGVTTHVVALESKIPFIITHSPGHMFITDLPLEKLENQLTIPPEF